MSTALRSGHKHTVNLILTYTYKSCLQPMPPGQQSQPLAKLFPRIYKQNGRKRPSICNYKTNNFILILESHRGKLALDSTSRKVSQAENSSTISVTPDSMSCPLHSKGPLATPFHEKQCWDKAEKQHRKKPTSVVLLGWGLAPQNQVLRERKSGESY